MDFSRLSVMNSIKLFSASSISFMNSFSSWLLSSPILRATLNLLILIMCLAFTSHYDFRLSQSSLITVFYCSKWSLFIRFRAVFSVNNCAWFLVIYTTLYLSAPILTSSIIIWSVLILVESSSRTFGLITRSLGGIFRYFSSSFQSTRVQPGRSGYADWFFSIASNKL